MRKKSFIGVTLVALLSSVLLVTRGGGGPKGVVQDYLKALEKQDVEKLSSMLCTDADPFLSLSASTFERFKAIEFDDLEFEESGDAEEAATIRVTGTMKIEFENGEKVTLPLDSNFELAKQEGNWCIVSSTDN